MAMQLKLHMVTMEDLMPQEHFLRKLESVLDLSFVYEEIRHLYSRKYGLPPIDPVILVKYLLVGYCTASHQSGRSSIASRWMWRCGGIQGWTLFDRVPDTTDLGHSLMPLGVFFLAVLSAFILCEGLCQQTHPGQRWGEGQRAASFSPPLFRPLIHPTPKRR